MASITETVQKGVEDIKDKLPQQVGRAPLQPTGALDQFSSFDVTPVIGREFPDASLKALLEAPNADELIQELAITSQQNLLRSYHCNH